MKKMNIKYTILLALLAVFASCEYEYDMPDMSDVKFKYAVSDLPDDLETELLDQVKATGRPMEAYRARFEPVIIEKDAAGSILYQGEPRSVVNKNTRTLELAYRCEAPLPSDLSMAGYQAYYGMGYFKFAKSFPVEISPYSMVLGVESGDRYTADLDMGCSVYSVRSEFFDVFDKDLEEIGYEIMGTSYTIEERNAAGEVINTFTPSSLNYYFASADSAKSVSISLTVSGRPKSGFSSGVPLYTYIFSKPFDLDVFSITDIVLTPDMEYTRQDPDKSSMGSIYSVTNGMISRIADEVKATGYEYYGVEYSAVEKDKDGNVLRTRDDISISYGEILSEIGAASVEITVRAYGTPPGEYRRTLVYEYKFTPVELDPLKPVNINLSPDMGYERTSPGTSSMSSVYTVRNDMKSVIAGDIEAAGHEWFGIDYIDYEVVERDAAGNELKRRILYDYSVDYGEPLTSVVGAASVEVTVYAYGRGEGAYDRVLVYLYKFPVYTLNPLQPTSIVLSADSGYTRE